MPVHTMTSVTIKDIPDELMERLRRRAAKDHRSLNKEAVHLLEAALSGLVPTDDAAHRKAAVEQQKNLNAKENEPICTQENRSM
jgi:plasmid stability protein